MIVNTIFKLSAYEFIGLSFDFYSKYIECFGSYFLELFYGES